MIHRYQDSVDSRYDLLPDTVGRTEDEVRTSACGLYIAPDVPGNELWTTRKRGQRQASLEQQEDAAGLKALVSLMCPICFPGMAELADMDFTGSVQIEEYRITGPFPCPDVLAEPAKKLSRVSGCPVDTTALLLLGSWNALALRDYTGIGLYISINSPRDNRAGFHFAEQSAFHDRRRADREAIWQRGFELTEEIPTFPSMISEEGDEPILCIAARRVAATLHAAELYQQGADAAATPVSVRSLIDGLAVVDWCVGNPQSTILFIWPVEAQFAATAWDYGGYQTPAALLPQQ